MEGYEISCWGMETPPPRFNLGNTWKITRQGAECVGRETPPPPAEFSISRHLFDALAAAVKHCSAANTL